MRFDLDRRCVSASGLDRLDSCQVPLGEVVGVQVCDAGLIRGIDSWSWYSYQLNLVLRKDRIVRLNLLENGSAMQLRLMAKEIAEFLDVKFYDHLGSQPSRPVS